MITTLTLLLFLSLPGFAPTERAIHIERKEPICIYNADDPLLRAVIRLESNFNPLAVNPVSGARGILQIMPDMIKEVNRICKKLGINEHYTWNDAFDPVKSIRIWYIAQEYHNPTYDTNLACQIWFGRGIQWDGMTWVEYSSIVKTHLYRT